MYKIESNIPIPTARWGSNKFPLREMGVGDSFVAPAEDRKKIQAAMGRYGRMNDKKFCIRSGKEDGKPSVRCWRTK